MKQTISKNDFIDAFHRCGRAEQYSYEAKTALYEYLEEIDAEYELDVIGLCCEYVEDSIKNVLKEYNLKDLEELQDNTCVVWSNDENVLYVAF